MYPEKKGGSHKMARLQQNWGLLTLVTRWASIWTMPNTASSKSEPPCGRAVYTPVRAIILGHPPQKTAPGGNILTSNTYNFNMFVKIFTYPKSLTAERCSSTHWGRNKMATILQTPFSWMQMFEFRLKFHWSLFPRVQLTIFQHWFR